MWAWLKRVDLAIFDWLVDLQVRETRVGKHRTPEGMLSTEQTIAALQAGWGYTEYMNRTA